MSWLTYSIALCGFALLAHLVVNKFYAKLPLHFDGQVEKGYEDVQKAFKWDINTDTLYPENCIQVYDSGKTFLTAGSPKEPLWLFL